MTPFGTRLARRHRATRPASASASTRTPRCCTSGGSTTTSPALERFALTVVEAVAPRVGVVKPQSAFYERFGSRGIAVLERVVAESRAAGALVLLDVKRGDIGSTSQAYADAYLDPASPLGRRRDHRQPLPRLRLARPDRRGRPPARRRPVRARPHLQPGGPRGAARAAPATAHRRRHGAGPPARRSTPGPSPSAPSAPWSGATIGSTDEDLDINGPLLVPGLRRPGRHRRRPRRIFGAAAGGRCRARRARCCGAGPDATALRDAALRGNDAVRDWARETPRPGGRSVAGLRLSRALRLRAATRRSATARPSRSTRPSSARSPPPTTPARCSTRSTTTTTSPSRRRATSPTTGRPSSTPLTGSSDALADARRRPVDYDAETPPAGLDEEQRAAIEAAAARGRLGADRARHGRRRAARARRLRHPAVALRASPAAVQITSPDSAVGLDCLPRRASD